MTDPIYALMLIGILGHEYYVWDKQADINFLKPGSSDLNAHFIISDDCVRWIKQQTADGDKCFPEFVVNVMNADGDTVATVKRVLYVRKKPNLEKKAAESEKRDLVLRST